MPDDKLDIFVRLVVYYITSSNCIICEYLTRIAIFLVFKIESASTSEHLRLLTFRLSMAVQTALRRRDNSLYQLYYQTLALGESTSSNQTVSIIVSAHYTFQMLLISVYLVLSLQTLCIVSVIHTRIKK